MNDAGTWYTEDPMTNHLNTSQFFIDLMYSSAKVYGTDGGFGIEPDYYTTAWSTYKIARKGNKHKLIKTGYNPEEHPKYQEVFKMYRAVVEGTIEIKGGRFYKTEDQ